MALSVAGVVLLTGGSGLAPLVLGLAAGTEGGVAVVKLSQGDFEGAGLSTVFMIFDTAELATLGKLVLKRSQTAFRALRNFDTAVDSLELIGDTARFVDVARLRSADVNVTDAGELAVIEATTRQDLFAEMAALTTPAKADAYVDAYFDSLVEGLDDPTNYDEILAAIKSDPAGPDAYVRWGDGAIDESGALVDEFADAVRGCSLQVAENSFGGSTYVVLADGSRKRIESIQVGDLVAGWDTSHGVVASTVTATWPHTDVLYEARLSDASTLVVTEDHDFYNVTGRSWAQIATFGPRSEFLSFDGAPVGLASFDFDSAITEDAYDLTVAGTHNYFVAADLTSHALLAHNQGGPCPKFDIPVDLLPSPTSGLSETDYIRMVDIGNTFVDGGRFSNGAELANELVVFINAADPATRTRLLSNPRWVQEAGTNGPADLRRLLRSAADNPVFGTISEETLQTLMARVDFLEVLDNMSFATRAALTQRILEGMLRSDNVVSVLRRLEPGSPPIVVAGSNGNNPRLLGLRGNTTPMRYVRPDNSNLIDADPILTDAVTGATTYKFKDGYEVTYPQIQLDDGTTAIGFPDFTTGTVPEGQVAVGATIELDPSDIFSINPDFQNANRRLAALIEAGDSSVADIPNVLRQWALDNRNSSLSPSEVGFTIHHTESTAIVQYVDSELHRLAQHAGGDASWGNKAGEL